MTTSFIRWQIVVDDPRFLDGESVHSFLELVDAATVGAYTVINEPAWFTDQIQGDRLDRSGSVIVGTVELLRAVKQYDGLEWFTFLFVGSVAQATEVADQKLLKQQLTYVKLAIRGADGQYYYVYTELDGIRDKIVQRYPEAEVRKAEIDQLDYPY
jgi:hypothetical protein